MSFPLISWDSVSGWAPNGHLAFHPLKIWVVSIDIYICICVSYFDGTNEFYGHIKRPLLSSNDTRINSHVICRGLPEVDCSTYYGECDDDSNWSQGLATPVGGQYPPTPKVSTHPFYIDISIFFYR